MRRLAKTSANAPGWCRITLAPLTPQTDRIGPTAHVPRPCHRRRAPAILTRRSPAMSAPPAMDGSGAEVSAAVDARSRPAGGMCGGNCRTQPTDGRSPLRETDRPDLARPRRAIRRPSYPPAADGSLAGLPGGQDVWHRAGRAPKSAAPCGTIETNRPCRRIAGLPAPCRLPQAISRSPARQIPRGSRPAPARVAPLRVRARSNRRLPATRHPAARTGLAKGRHRLAGCPNGPKPVPPVARPDP